MSVRFASWHVIVDDIVFPDGGTAMVTLGGGGLHAVAGMRLWTRDVGIFGNVGRDFDLNLLRPLGVDCAGLRITDRPTPRAWQLFEADGRRTQVPRIADDDWNAQLLPSLAELGVAPRLQAVHYLCLGTEHDAGNLAELAGRGVRLSVEPIIEGGISAQEKQRMLDCLPLVELFSPGLNEAAVLTGERLPAAMVRALSAYGPRIVALRRGAAGSLVYERESGCLLQVPAAPARVVDVTGAGNAYCGGLLVGWIDHGHLDIAAACAAVSAALTIEQVGPVKASVERERDAHTRRARLLPQIVSEGGAVHA